MLLYKGQNGQWHRVRQGQNVRWQGGKTRYRHVGPRLIGGRGQCRDLRGNSGEQVVRTSQIGFYGGKHLFGIVSKALVELILFAL
jgi:hypothetical protein